MTVNPLQYTSRTFDTVLDDINNDENLVDKPEWFKRLIAGSHDVLAMYENAIANESFLRTAFTRQATADLLALIDYYLAEKATSTGTLIFYLDPDAVAFPKIVLVEDFAARSEGSISVSSRKFEARAGDTMVATSEGFLTNFAVDNNLDVARQYATGEKVRVASDNTLPDPLLVDTDYYVILISATEIRLASTLANAYLGTEIALTDDGLGNHTVTLYSMQVDCYQQDTKDSVSLGISDGITEWQRFDFPDLDVISGTVTILINALAWTIEDTLVDSGATDKHCLHRYNTDGSSYLLFGNGIYGKIPANFDVNVTYAIGGGALANITKVNSINVYAGSDSDILGVSNPAAFTGGSEAESLESGKNLGPILLKARDRFVTLDDGIGLAVNYGGVARANVIRDAYGVLSCQVPIVPSGGGVPGAPLLAALQTYLIDRTILESIDVRVTVPTYNTITPVAAFKIKVGYLFATEQPYIMLALRLLFYEATNEILDDYEQNGIASAVTIINNLWATSFATADYDQIVNLLENITATDFDTDYQESDVLGFLDTYLFGVDYITWATPVFPITQAEDEITTDNVIIGNITETP